MTLRMFAPALIASLGLSTAAVAEEGSTASEIKEDVKEAENPWIASANARLRSSTKNSEEYDYVRSLSVSGTVGYEFEDIGDLSLSVAGSKALNNEYRSTFTEASLAFGRSFLLMGEEDKSEASETATDAATASSSTEDLSVESDPNSLSLGVGVSYGIPVNKDLLKYSNSKGSLGAGVSLDYGFGGFLKGLSLSLGYGYERYLYQYQDTNGGTLLTKWSVTQSIDASYNWNALTAAVSFSNSSAWDFNGNKEDDTFLATQTLSYKVNDNWTAQVGHINDGNTFDYGGASNNVQIYDRYRSQVFIGGIYKF